MSFIICIVLVAAIALFTTACNGINETDTASTSAHTTAPTKVKAENLGVGETEFNFSVVDLSGNEKNYIIKTNKKTVGEALFELELIDGDKDQYGLYVKKVNGTTLDYDKDGAYWAFYVNGSYATSGVDKTEIDETAEYSFKAENA